MRENPRRQSDATAVVKALAAEIARVMPIDGVGRAVAQPGDRTALKSQ